MEIKFEKQPQSTSLEAGNIKEEFKKERQKETLPALEVNNIAVWVNPAFENLPFKIEEGKSTNLGIFLTPKPEIHSANETIQQAKLMPEEISGRSILFGEFEFKDKEGRLYRDVDLKGTGTFLKTETGQYVVGEIRKRGNNPELEAKGLMNYNGALKSKDCAEIFLSNGIRTNRVIAILDLKEIINKEGNKISIEKAKEIGIIPEAMRPVIMIRAFNTKERIDYIKRISTEKEKQRAMLALDDAKTLVAQELHRNPSDFSLNDYLKWFAETLGEQIAKIKKVGFYSGNLHPQNITLDCSIVDLEEFQVVEKVFSKNEREYYYHTHIREQLEQHLSLKKGELTPEIVYRSEFDGAVDSLNVFLQSVENLTHEIRQEDKQQYIDLCTNAYNKELAREKKE